MIAATTSTPEQYSVCTLSLSTSVCTHCENRVALFPGFPPSPAIILHFKVSLTLFNTKQFSCIWTFDFERKKGTFQVHNCHVVFCCL